MHPRVNINQSFIVDGKDSIGCFVNKIYMVLPSPQIAIGLLLINIGIVVTFDIKIDQFKSKE